MTGYGKAEGIISGRKITIQIKSLNSKQTDITVKVPSLFKDQELSFRKQLSSSLQRGKIEMYLSYESAEAASSYKIDEDKFKAYHAQLLRISSDLKLDESEFLSSILRLPEVIKTKEEEVDENDTDAFLALLNEAIKAINEFRAAEGKVLEDDLRMNIRSIEGYLEDALKYESDRTETVRTRLLGNIEELNQKDKLDKDRFEQELIYYMEKYDISEEKVRLQAHCDYFQKTMNEAEGQGKKLGFISQEIGREINTLGSKANHAEMQKSVVQMKEQLEKIKEQVLNVL